MINFKYPNKVNLKNYSHSNKKNTAFYGLPTNIEFCNSCTYSNQKPNSEKEYSHNTKTKKPSLQLNDKGTCRACFLNSSKDRSIDWDLREKELKELCNKFRSKKGEYDCLVPGSGGKDSFFTAYTLKYKYGMNPLTFTFAPHIYTSWGWKNFQNWMHSGLDNFLYTPNGRIHRLLTRISLENIFHPFQPFMFGQNYIAPKLSSEMFNINLIFYGESPAEYGNQDSIVSPLKLLDTFSTPNPNNSFIGGLNLNELKQFGISKKDLNPYLPINTEKFFDSKNEIHYLGYYIKWHPQEAYYFAVENSNFISAPERTAGTYSKYASLDDKMDDLHYYTTFIKFGVGRATYDTAQEIRNGELTRDEGINLVKKYDGEYSKRFEKENFEYLSINKKEFPIAYKYFDHPKMNKKYFDLLTDQFKSPHLWKYQNKKWQLRKTIY